MIILGIETTCDETGVGIVQNDDTLLANTVATSLDQHIVYGGVVPEVAARAQYEYMIPTLEAALQQANLTWDNIDAIAYAKEPGLGGSLLVGSMTAKTLAQTLQKPLYGLHHAHGHIAVNFLINNDLGYSMPVSAPTFPFIGLIVSGGHTHIYLYRSMQDYTLLGQTRDDAVGEAFDKVAKLLGLPYPGGPSVSSLAEEGNDQVYSLPISRLENPYDFSFSGLKTAVLRTLQKDIGKDFTFPSYQIPDKLNDEQKANMAASFQHVAVKTLVSKTIKAANNHNIETIVLGGGVSANSLLRNMLSSSFNGSVIYTDPRLSTDNGAMIAALSAHINS